MANPILFTHVPHVLLFGETKYKAIPTSNVKRVFDSLGSDWEMNIQEGLPVVAYQGIGDKERTDGFIQDLQIGQYIQAFKQQHGQYVFIHCPMERIINGKVYQSGILLYNEHGKVYFIFYYVQMSYLYHIYCLRCQEEPLPYSQTIFCAELLKYLLNTNIPRLKRGSLE